MVTDPWEFEDENATADLEGTISAIRNSAILIGLSNPIRFRDEEFNGVVATPRFLEPWKVIEKQGVSVNLTPARGSSEDAEEQFAAADSWRAWCLIADMSLLK